MCGCVHRNTVAVAKLCHASLAQLAEHALRKRTVVGSIPTGGFVAAVFFGSLISNSASDGTTPPKSGNCVARRARRPASASESLLPSAHTWQGRAQSPPNTTHCNPQSLELRRTGLSASLAQLVEHALRKRMVVGSIPTGGFITAVFSAL